MGEAWKQFLVVPKVLRYSGKLMVLALMGGAVWACEEQSSYRWSPTERTCDRCEWLAKDASLAARAMVSDGETLYVLRRGTPELWAYPTDGGEAKRLSDSVYSGTELVDLGDRVWAWERSAPGSVITSVMKESGETTELWYSGSLDGDLIERLLATSGQGVAEIRTLAGARRLVRLGLDGGEVEVLAEAEPTPDGPDFSRFSLHDLGPPGLLWSDQDSLGITLRLERAGEPPILQRMPSEDSERCSFPRWGSAGEVLCQRYDELFELKGGEWTQFVHSSVPELWMLAFPGGYWGVDHTPQGMAIVVLDENGEQLERYVGSPMNCRTAAPVADAHWVYVSECDGLYRFPLEGLQ